MQLDEEAGSAGAAGAPRKGDGYRLDPRPAGPALSVSRWTGEVEAVLGTETRVGVAITAPLDLARLVPFADRIRSLTVTEEFRGDLSPVEGLHALERLSLARPPKRVDLSCFPKLRECRLVGAEHVAGLARAPLLGRLDLETPRLESLEELAGLGALRELFIERASRLETLAGIEGLGIDRVRIYQARALRRVGALGALASLRELSLDGVRAVEDLEKVGGAAAMEALVIEAGPPLDGFDFVAGLRRLRSFFVGGTDGPPGAASIAPLLELQELRVLTLASAIERATDLERLGELASLEVLGLVGGPELPSLRFLEPLRRLRILTLYTTVRDGDLSILLTLPELRQVRLKPHPKRYSHTPEELKAAIFARHPEVALADRLRPRPPPPRAASANPPPAASVAPPVAAGGIPADVLAEVPWRFDTRVEDRDHLASLVAAEVGPETGWDPDRLVVGVPRLRLGVPGFDDETPLELQGDRPDGFTAAGLLSAVHTAVAALVGDTDYRYFEGLVLVDEAPDGAPLYELRLGS